MSTAPAVISAGTRRTKWIEKPLSGLSQSYVAGASETSRTVSLRASVNRSRNRMGPQNLGTRFGTRIVGNIGDIVLWSTEDRDVLVQPQEPHF
jgi:hypothetical protein